MKVLIYIGCFFVLAVIQTVIRRAGIRLGGIPTAVLFACAWWIANMLSNKTDKGNGRSEQQKTEGKNILTAICSDGAMKGKSATGEVVYIGRDTQLCQLIFPDSAYEIARVHCMLHRNGEKIELRDMKALSGTYLMNGTRLKPDETVELENGETFYLSSPSNAISVVLGSRENAKEIKDYKYVCSACGRRRTGWYQKCPDCGSVETITLYEENRIQELYGCPNVKELERYELLKTVEVVDYARRDSAT